MTPAQAEAQFDLSLSFNFEQDFDTLWKKVKEKREQEMISQATFHFHQIWVKRPLQARIKLRKREKKKIREPISEISETELTGS